MFKSTQDKILSDRQQVLAIIPDFLELPIEQALHKFDDAIESGELRLKSISYSPSVHWAIGQHIKEHG